MKFKLQPGMMTELQYLTADDLTNDELLDQLFAIRDDVERARLRERFLLEAKRCGVFEEVKALLQSRALRHARIERTGGVTNRTDFSFQTQKLDCGDWTACDSGVWRTKPDGTRQVASPIPVLPAALLTNDEDGTEKVQLDFRKGKGNVRSVVCERSVTASASRIVALADRGLEVNSENARLLVRYISDVIALNIDRIPQRRAVSTMGWKGKDFMPYADGIYFDGEEENRDLYGAIRAKGSLDQWVDFAADMRRDRTKRILMDASFASALIEPLHALPFVFHLWGASGKGKTVALCMAMSVWGDPTPGKLVRTMNMTQNAMLSTAAFLRSIPFAGDELQTIKSQFENYDKLIMKVTEGIDRGRMHYDKLCPTRAWNCAFLFTGEEPCVTAQSGGGTVNRVLSCEVTDDLFDASGGNETMRFLSQHHGRAGKVFTKYVREQTDLAERYLELVRAVHASCGTTDKQASSMALILLADQLVGECLISREPPLEPAVAQSYVAAAKDVDVSARAYAFVLDLVSRNQKRFDWRDKDNRDVWGKIEDGVILFNATVLRQELHREGFDLNAVKSAWAQSGCLERAPDRKFTHKTRFGAVTARCYKLCIPDTDAQTASQEGFPFG